MRRSSRYFLPSLLLGVATLAFAGSVVHTSTSNWSSGQAINIDTSNNELDLAVLDNQVDAWIRHPWDDFTYEAEGTKDNGNLFSTGDRCLRDSDNGAINGPTAIGARDEFRTGTQVQNISGTNYVASVPATAILPLPAGMNTVDQVRFLTGGSRIAQTSYTVRFHYSDATISQVVVPIAIDTTLVGARDAVGTNFSIEASPAWSRTRTPPGTPTRSTGRTAPAAAPTT